MSKNNNLPATTTDISTKSSRRRLPDGVRGVIVGIAAGGEPMIDFCANPTGAPVPAASTINIQPNDIGREAILLFEDGDPSRPILLGLLQRDIPVQEPDKKRKSVEASDDGQRLILTADQEIVLRCGEASITLTRIGKVLIRGAYLLSRSTGPNRIKGGSIHLN